MRMRTFAVCLVMGGLAAIVSASDRWETTFLNLTDDSAFTLNVLRHGVPQVGHDLEGTVATPDQDWMRIRVKPGHSYEGRVSSSGLHWDPSCGAPPCPRFDRVNLAGAILTAGVPSNDDPSGFELGPGQGIVSSGLSARWISTVDGTEFLRAVGDQAFALPANLGYDVEFYDTTYFVPRWNNSATQVTVFMIQNTTNATVTGDIIFYNTAGGTVSTQALNVPARGLQVLNTSSVPALSGLSGAAAVAHTGGYGALAGKAVALEPATGFSFDTPLTPLPR